MRGARILLVDDQLEILQLLSNHLTHKGYDWPRRGTAGRP